MSGSNNYKGTRFFIILYYYTVVGNYIATMKSTFLFKF